MTTPQKLRQKFEPDRGKRSMLTPFFSDQDSRVSRLLAVPSLNLSQRRMVRPASTIFRVNLQAWKIRQLDIGTG
jgi:hypothetical protein